jgi:U6 snRNA-associated Sm-like protein LSm8
MAHVGEQQARKKAKSYDGGGAEKRDYNAKHDLADYVNQIVTVITCDGRNIVGLMLGFDQTINVILQDCHERVYSLDEGVQQVPLGLYIVRGDNVAVIGEVDEDMELAVDLSKVRAPGLRSVVH